MWPPSRRPEASPIPTAPVVNVSSHGPPRSEGASRPPRPCVRLRRFEWPTTAARSTTRPTSATRWPASARSRSRTRRPATAPAPAAERRQEVQDRAGRVHRHPAASRSGRSVSAETAGRAALGLRHDADDRHRGLHGAGAPPGRRATGSSSTRSVHDPARCRQRRRRPRGRGTRRRVLRRVRGPRSAVDAAIAVQRELLGRAWADDLDVRVRIGIHSGYPTSTETNYIGMDVHTTSRICGVGHGGQVVVSANTREAREGVGARRRALHGPWLPPPARPARCGAALSGRRGGAADPVPPTADIGGRVALGRSRGPRRAPAAR